MKTLLVALAVAVALPSVTSAAMAGTSGYAKPPGYVNGKVKFALHLAQHSTTGCKLLPTINSRRDIVSRWVTLDVDLNVFVVVFDYDSLSIVEYGLNWPVDWGSASTVVCEPNTITVGTIKNSGDGMAMAWSSENCILHSVKPYFLPAYSWILPSTNGTIEIRDNPATQNNDVVDCRASRYEYPDTVFNAFVGPDATEPTTWGSIKAAFR